MSYPQPAPYPPRYEQVGNWKHLICDEPEWLARPAAWGVDVLLEPVRERKRNLFNAHYYGWLAQFVACSECRPHVREMFGEDGLKVPAALAMPGAYSRAMRTQLRARYDASHPTGECDAKPIVRCVCNYECGITTQTELFNRVVDELYSITDRLDREGRQPHRHKLRALKVRELALELVGPNPFRPVAFAPEWRTDTAVALARQMYESGDFGAMAILADALQDAGCDSDDILSHCRDAEQVHVRGCWVTDLVLGKQ